jgi:hexosaminidase
MVREYNPEFRKRRRRVMNTGITITLLCIFLFTSGNRVFASQDPDSALHARGYNIIPCPRQVALLSADIVVDASWVLHSEAGNDIAVREFTRSVDKAYQLKFSSSGTKKITFSIQSGIVKGTSDEELNKQGYVIRLASNNIHIIGNTKAGLFYGVQSLLQLLKKDPSGLLLLPQGEIRDWPNLQLRFVHWDTKNHLDRMSALKEYIDRLARLKINMISFEIWDKFKFLTDPVIGVKEAFTPDQLQQLVDYALERHIQIVPNIQAPAHMQWVLKHEKYAHLRADGSDYQACMCDPETYRIIFSLFQDVIDATKGVSYFHVSTDEVYYAGICKKCDRPYNPENRSLAFVDFVNKAHEFLSKRNRRMLFWGEWPLMPEHIARLPSDIIEGVLGSSYFVGRIQPITEESYITEENHKGIRQLIYTAQTASLAPVNFSGGGRGQSMENLYKWFTVKSKRGNPIGAFAAGWDDLGPHSELYWLGWSAVAAFSWNKDAPKNIERFVAQFMVDFYGPQVHGMIDVFRDMDKLSNFWNRSWDKVVNEVPGTGSTRASYGNSDGKWAYPRPLSTNTLPAPALPFSAGLNVRPIYASGKYKDLVSEAVLMEQLASSLIYRLEENRVRAKANDYNLRVLVTLTMYMRHHARLFISMNEMENHLQSAEKLAAVGDAKAAVEALLFANGVAKNNIAEREETVADMKKVFSETRVPGHLTLEHRYFEQEQTIGIDKWLTRLGEITVEYATKHKLDVKPIQNILNKGLYTGENTGE